MHGIPKELEEAAEIDGCGKFTTFLGSSFPFPYRAWQHWVSITE
jgi:ABC-type glycerol-3-phosphate transport system permease component